MELTILKNSLRWHLSPLGTSKVQIPLKTQLICRLQSEICLTDIILVTKLLIALLDFQLEKMVKRVLSQYKEMEEI